MVEIARARGVSSAQVALSALSRLPDYYSGVIPIVGASSPEQIRDSLRFLDLGLSDEEMARLHPVSKPRLIYPHGILRGPVGARMTGGGRMDLLDNHRR